MRIWTPALGLGRMPDRVAVTPDSSDATYGNSRRHLPQRAVNHRRKGVIADSAVLTSIAEQDLASGSLLSAHVGQNAINLRGERG